MGWNSGGEAVQLVLGTRDRRVGRQVLAAFQRYVGGLVAAEGQRALRVLVTEDAEQSAGIEADAVVLLSGDCRTQVFPSDLRCEPIRLRLPLSVVALRVALDYAAVKAGRPGCAAARP
jgi:hypothetical protein